MITDERARYALTALDGTTLWRYDRRWRRRETIEPTAGQPFEYVEGVNHFTLAIFDHGVAHLSVRSVAEPMTVLASGTFSEGIWEFAGDARSWTLVPEHVLIPTANGNRALLRIADGATPDPLEELGPVTRLAHVPKSRLVALAGGGSVTIYDPGSRIAGVKFRLANENDAPTMRFRADGDELWLDDVDTMLKMETRNWTVIDAAGSQPADEAEALHIDSWSFTPDESSALVVRSSSRDIVLIAADTMEPVDAVTFRSPPVDAAVLDGHLVAVDRDGVALRSKVKT